MRDAIEIVAEHYQKTYGLTLQMWEQRNTTFLALTHSSRRCYYYLGTGWNKLANIQISSAHRTN